MRHDYLQYTDMDRRSPPGFEAPAALVVVVIQLSEASHGQNEVAVVAAASGVAVALCPEHPRFSVVSGARSRSPYVPPR